MKKRNLVFSIPALAVTFKTHYAFSAAPPKGSFDDQVLGPYSAWMERQHNPGGENCCNTADGRAVKTQIGDRGQLQAFIGSQFDNSPPNTWVDVPKKAVIPTQNPTGYAVAWWVYDNYHGKGEIRCFVDISKV